YNAIKNSLATVRRKQTGNLSVKSLDGIVTRENCITDSEYLVTAFVAVPKNLTKEWTNAYERLTDMVVPRSSKKIAEDSEYVLYSVVLFKRVLDEFTTKARDARFIVRDFVYDEEAMARDQLRAREIVEQEEELLDNIAEWIKGSFSAVFSAWVHIKALRVFVESILRYGIPPDFLPILTDDGAFDMHEFSNVLSDYTPFVFFELPWTFLDSD
ncbi:Vacuolar ATP synthase subunit C, partial [Coemansia sp. RSA 2611]